MDDDNEECPFGILHLPASASEEEVLKQWRKLLLQHHPDKSTDPHASDISKRLNDAKQRATAVCAQRKQDELHQHEVAEHIARLRHMVRIQFIAPISQYKELNQQIKQLLAECKQELKQPLNPRPILGAYWLLVLSIDLKTQRLEKEANELRAEIEELKKKHADAKPDTLQAELDAERLAKEHSIAEAHKANAAAEQARTELAAAKAQWDAEREAMQAQINACKQLNKTEDACEVKKRKHRRYLSQEEGVRFRDSIHDFVVNHLRSSATAFTCTSSIQECFQQLNPGINFSKMVFQKELKQQIASAKPNARAKQVNTQNGYDGVILSMPEDYQLNRPKG